MYSYCAQSIEDADGTPVPCGHTFEAVDEEQARKICESLGYEYMGELSALEAELAEHQDGVIIEFILDTDRKMH